MQEISWYVVRVIILPTLGLRKKNKQKEQTSMKPLAEVKVREC